jgi:hypothetical protein
MSPVFALDQGKARQLGPAPFKSEKDLQQFFESNLETLLGIRFVATEFSIGEKYGGRIDSLGLDESGNPVILEYKWEKSDSVISQGLFYLDWLVGHRGDFELAARKRLGQNITVAWSNPRLILIAGNYSKYDGYGINRLSPSIERCDIAATAMTSLLLRTFLSQWMLNARKGHSRTDCYWLDRRPRLRARLPPRQN